MSHIICVCLIMQVRYVLERRQAVKAGRIRPGVLLERPSLLAQVRVCG